MIAEWYERVSDSLFLIPAAIIAGFGAAARGAVLVDATLEPGQPWLLATTVDSARSILSTVATATVTVAAIVFSMTAVVVQLATSQFSPRVTQGFLRNRYQQVTVGLTLGTFVFALLVLATVRGSEEGVQTNRDFSVTVGVIFAVVSMVAIVSFIDRIMRNMRIDTIIRGLAERTEASIQHLPDRSPADTDALRPPDNDSVSVVPVGTSGWVLGIDVEAILAALPGDTAVRLDLRTGDFMAKGEAIATVWPEVDDKARRAIFHAVEFGRVRTITGDPVYGIRQMVDVALRALSPATNDATTAADVVHHLSGPLQAVLLHDLPARVVGDARGNGVYLPRALTYSDYVHGAFQEIRMRSADQPHVLRALLETLSSLISVVEDAGHESRCGALYQEADATIALVSEMEELDRRYLLDFARTQGLVASRSGSGAQ